MKIIFIGKGLNGGMKPARGNKKDEKDEKDENSGGLSQKLKNIDDKKIKNKKPIETWISPGSNEKKKSIVKEKIERS